MGGVTYRVGQGEVGGITRRVTCTWWPLGLAVKAPRVSQFLPWLHGRLRKHHSRLVEGSFSAGKAAWALRRCMMTKTADYCMLVNEVKVMSLLGNVELVQFWSQSLDRNKDSVR